MEEPAGDEQDTWAQRLDTMAIAIDAIVTTFLFDEENIVVKSAKLMSLGLRATAKWLRRTK